MGGSLAAASALVAYSIGDYLFGALSHLEFLPSAGNSIAAALVMASLILAEVLSRPDREPVVWLLARPTGFCWFSWPESCSFCRF